MQKQNVFTKTIFHILINATMIKNVFLRMAPFVLVDYYTIITFPFSVFSVCCVVTIGKMVIDIIIILICTSVYIIDNLVSTTLDPSIELNPCHVFI